MPTPVPVTANNKDGNSLAHLHLGLIYEKEQEIDDAKKHFKFAMQKGNILGYEKLLHHSIDEKNLQEVIQTIKNAPVEIREDPMSKLMLNIINHSGEWPNGSIKIEDCDDQEDFFTLESLDDVDDVFVFELYDTHHNVVKQFCSKVINFLAYLKENQSYKLVHGKKMLKNPVPGVNPLIALDEIMTMGRKLNKSKFRF